YPQLAELLQQFSETGTAAPELIDAITGSDPPPTDLDKFVLANREEASDAIQCSDSTVPTKLAAYSRAALAADSASPDFGRISAFEVMPSAFLERHHTD